MSHAPTINWRGRSGREYAYHIYPIGTEFKSAPGNYVFAKQTRPNTFQPIYIGETEDLSQRFDNHHKMPCIRRNGATHITVHANYNGEQARKAEEADLIANYRPICNE